MTLNPVDRGQEILASARAIVGRDDGILASPHATPVSDVSLAFALGWDMSVLYLGKPGDTYLRTALSANRLPSLSRLSDSERSLVRLDQIRGIAAHFKASFRAAGVKPLPETDEVETLIEKGNTVEEIRESLRELHMSLLRALSASNPRLAKSYHLGVALAKTCHIPSDAKSLTREFDRQRLANLGEWLADLASLFPPHASRAVRLSVSAWRRWVDDPQINPVEAQDAVDPPVGTVRRVRRKARAQTTGSRPLDWDKDGDGVLLSLSRQGEVWRALLSGEKQGDAMLELPDYVEAAVQTLRRMVRLLRGVWIPVGVGLAVFLGGLLVLVDNGSTGKLLAGVATVTGAIGFTWKGTLGAIGQVATNLEHPVWGAELDDEIAQAITKLPPGADLNWEEPKDAAPASGPQPALHLSPDATPAPGS